jgi:serine/threonine protein kinase
LRIGGFGVVELVSDIYTKQEMVLKRCNIDRQESFDIANTEIKMLQKFKGPYVVNLLDSCVYQKSKTTREAFLLMEYYPGDHLLNRLLQRNGAHLPQDAIFRMFGQLCLAVKDMHLSRPAIVHRDIKLENVLFGQVRIVTLKVMVLQIF